MGRNCGSDPGHGGPHGTIAPGQGRTRSGGGASVGNGGRVVMTMPTDQHTMRAALLAATWAALYRMIRPSGTQRAARVRQRITMPSLLP
jgi:hypothetical protein